MKWKCRQFEEIFVTDCTKSYQNDNPLWNRRKFNQNDGIYASDYFNYSEITTIIQRFSLWYYSDVTSVPWHLKSPAIGIFVQQPNKQGVQRTTTFPQHLDQWANSSFMGQQDGNWSICHALWPMRKPIGHPTLYPSHISFTPSQSTFPFLKYDY